MTLIKPDTLRKHPIAWGLLWAAATLALVYLINYALGERLPNLSIVIPIWAVAGAGWGYLVKWSFDRKGREL